MPHSCAIAGRCSAALVEPPEAATRLPRSPAPFCVTMSRGRMPALMRLDYLLPAVMQNGRGSHKAQARRPNRAKPSPIASETVAMVLAVN